MDENSARRDHNRAVDGGRRSAALPPPPPPTSASNLRRASARAWASKPFARGADSLGNAVFAQSAAAARALREASARLTGERFEGL